MKKMRSVIELVDVMKVSDEESTLLTEAKSYEQATAKCVRSFVSQCGQFRHTDRGSQKIHVHGEKQGYSGNAWKARYCHLYHEQVRYG